MVRRWEGETRRAPRAEGSPEPRLAGQAWLRGWSASTTRVVRGGGAGCSRCPETPGRPRAGGEAGAVGGGEMGEGEMEGGRRPPPRPRGLPHVALVAGLLRVPAGTKEELQRSGACPLPAAPPHPHPLPRQGWGVPQGTKRGAGWAGAQEHTVRARLVSSTRSLPSRGLPRAPTARDGGGVLVWPTGCLEAQTKGLPRSHRGGGEATSERHDRVFCRREARPGPPLYLPRPHPHPQCEDGDCAPGPLSGI